MSEYLDFAVDTARAVFGGRSPDPRLHRDLHNLTGVGFSRALGRPSTFEAHGCRVVFDHDPAGDAWTCLIGFPDRPDQLEFSVPVNTLLGLPE